VNSIKNTIVTVTLLAVGYGTYVVLSEPAPTDVAQLSTDTGWDAAGDPSQDLAEVAVQLPDETSNADRSVPPSAEPSSTAQGSGSPSSSDAPVGMQAPDPQDVPADSLAAPSADTDRGDPGNPPATAPWPTDLSPPSGAPPAAAATAGAAEPPATEDDGGYYARQNDPQATATYPETSTPSYPASEPSQAPVPGAPAGSTDVAGHPGFEETWKAVQANLKNGQLADALFSLTVWHEEPALSPEQSERCIQLLDQLAGTVIYSRESFLEHAHVVQDGETLESLAEQYSVPQEFLARINGILPPYQLSPGESLKVVRGPFRAEINRARSEITVFLGRYYAGRFPARLGADLPPENNLYEVIAKENGREFFDRRTGDRITRDDPRNPYGDRWIGLRGEQITAAHNVGIHVDAGTSDLCCVAVSRVDADDLSAILSVGSRISVKP
jgi:hypothetical protein